MSNNSKPVKPYTCGVTKKTRRKLIIHIHTDKVTQQYEVIYLKQGISLVRWQDNQPIVRYINAVDRSLWSCDCEDAEYRDHAHNCKHVRALKALMKENRIPSLK